MEEKKQQEEMGASLFGRSIDLMDGDPLEEIFALNLGDFVSECLISNDLAEKIAKKENSKEKQIENLKKQLQELVSIYSLKNTLCVLSFNSKEDYFIYNSIAKTVSQMLDVDACHVYLTKDYSKGLTSVNKDLFLVGSSLGFTRDIYKENIGFSLKAKNPVCDAFNEKEVVKFSVDETHKSVPGTILNENKVKELYAIPMSNNMYEVGVIVIESYTNRTFKPELFNLVVSMARLFATSMSLQTTVDETNRLLQEDAVSEMELKHMRTELTALIGDLEDEQQNFVQLLAKAVDAKGEYKVAHSQLTADLSRRICKKLKLNEKTSDLIYYAGLLQNVGKLLMNINFLSEVVPYIHYHKERWDGKGEPEGLKGMSIPFGSRIIAIADAYTALTSERPFREAMKKEQALNILREETESKWDPIVFKALEEVISE